MPAYVIVLVGATLGVIAAMALGAVIGLRLRPKYQAWLEREQRQTWRAPQRGYTAERGVTEPGEGFEYTLDHLPPCLEPYSEFVDLLIQPCVYMRSKPDAEVSPTNTRLGGWPALPVGEAWPVERNGRPMEFIGQLNMSELRETLADKAQAARLPEQGLLLLFVGHDQTCLGDDKAEAWRVLWRPVGSEPVEVTKPPTEEIDFSACRLELFAGRSLPSCEDAVVKLKAELTENEMLNEAWHELGVSAAPQPAHQCLGYCQPIQGDPRLELKEGQGRQRQEFDPSRWLLLWQIDTDDDAGLMWGDCGMLFLLIHEDDLADGRLERARPVMQCH